MFGLARRIKARLGTIIGTLVLAAGVAAIGGVAFVYAGVYDIAATEAHTAPARTTLSAVSRQSVQRRAAGVEVPPLDDASLIRRGFVLYDELCVTCHGAPGVAKSRIGIGMNPNPPPLEDATRRWSDAEIYWIIENGLKMAGMPAFGVGERPRDSWALTAFVRRLRTVTPGDYARMRAAIADPAAAPVAWVVDEPALGWARLATGDAERGRRAIDELGCGTCHRIPGIRTAQGRLAPPLDGWASRHYLAGVELNVPASLVAWLLDPPAVKPGTAMPAVGATEAQAWDVARYLYTLE